MHTPSSRFIEVLPPYPPLPTPVPLVLCHRQDGYCTLFCVDNMMLEFISPFLSHETVCDLAWHSAKSCKSMPPRPETRGLQQRQRKIANDSQAAVGALRESPAAL